jgi:DNA-directed RNA polymerase subunit RPC12/RpoP
MIQKQYECLECGKITSETAIGNELFCPDCGGHVELFKIANHSKNNNNAGQQHLIKDLTVEEKEYTGFFAPEKKGIDKGVAGGFLMIIIAIVWFIGGYAAGYIFYYPPILFIIGLYALVKGLVTDNWSGKE